MDAEKLSHVGKQLFRSIEFDDQEKLIYEIRKHPFGLFIIYASGFFIAALLGAILIGGGFMISGDTFGAGVDVTSLRAIIVLVGLVLVVFSLVITAVQAYLYKNNVVIITSDKLAQFLYPSLFNRKISQLSIGDVQDVTIKQEGFLPHLFNYGTLVVETAGEQQNYTFTFAPDPYECGKAIVGAHEENLKQYGN